jgi:hypothetical protein
VAKSLLERAARGDTTVLDELKKLLDDQPGVWRAYGDLAARAQESWVDLAAGTNLLLKESLERHAQALRAEVAGPNAPPLERLLAERVVATWLQLNYADADAAVARKRGVGAATLRELAKRQESAERRHQAAVK